MTRQEYEECGNAFAQGFKQGFEDVSRKISKADREASQSFAQFENVLGKIVIKSEPFSWNDNLSKIALEDFQAIRSSLSYCTAQSIGTALAKLQLMESKGLNPDTLDNIIEKLEEWENDYKQPLNDYEIGKGFAYSNAASYIKGLSNELKG